MTRKAGRVIRLRCWTRWTIVCGFGGFRVRNGQMTFKPWLPPDWNAVDFRLKWHGNTVSVSADHTRAIFVLTGPEGCRETIIVNSREITLQANRKVTVGLLRAPPSYDLLAIALPITAPATATPPVSLPWRSGRPARRSAG